jgi:predicted dehydrogenase
VTDHTYCYTPAVIRIREIIETGALGDLLFLDSVRINLGLIQPDVDVFWDLAPHDLSIIDFVLPGGLRPRCPPAPTAEPAGLHRLPDVPLDNSAIAHVRS